MKRTQVYLEEETIKELDQLASKENKPKSVLIRQFLQAGVKAVKAENPSDILLRLADMGIKTGDRYLSKNINRYLYGGKRNSK